MKMNKFRNNLHPAFFDTPENMSDKQRYYPSTEKKPDAIPTPGISPEAAKKLIDKTKEQVDGAKTDVIDGQEFQNIAGKVAAKVSRNYRDRESLRKDAERFRIRVRENTEARDQKITQGRGALLTALREENYFENEESEEKIAKVKEKYKKEVEKQYEKNIWYAEDTEYNQEKNRLFGDTSPNYPANKIYCELTGASTISTAGRSFRTGYGIDKLIDEEEDPSSDEKNNQKETDDVNNKFLTTKEINFLSRDLPKYLWNIRVKTLGNLDLGVVSFEEDRPSKIDRKAIKQFLNAAGKITFEKGEDATKKLLEVFRDNRLTQRSGKRNYEKILKEHGVSIPRDEKYDEYMSEIIKAGTFYIDTQRNKKSSRDQHAIYLDVLTIIEEAGGAKEAIDQNKEKVEGAKEIRKSEKKEGYASGEYLLGDEGSGEIYDLAKQLGITDFASVTRLARKSLDMEERDAQGNPTPKEEKEKAKKYFEKTPVKKIIANLNNDDDLNAGDFVEGGQKSGQQFLKILEQLNIDEGTALNNLYERAKLENKMLGLNILQGNESKKDIEDSIKRGDAGIILLLQNIISKPGEDLYTLLSGHKEGESAIDRFDTATLEKAETDGKLREKAFEKAGKIINEKGNLDGYKKLFEGKKGIDVTNFADLQAALASCLYDNYKLGLGVGATLSFDKWAEGLTISTGAQVRNKGAMLGLNIGYNKSFDAGNGWTLTPGLSAGVFLPIAQGSKDAIASAGLSFSADKRNVNLNTGAAHHYGFDAGFNVVTTTVYGGWHESWDKLEGLQEAANFQSQKFEQVIMRDLLNNIIEDVPEKEGKKIMDLNDPNILDIVKSNIIKEIESQEGISEGDKENMVNGMLRMLSVYDDADLNKSGVKYLMAGNIAEQYKHSWIEQRKIDIQNGGAYISGYSLGAFWKVGTPLVGVYATVSGTRQEIDGRGDKKWNSYEQQEQYQDTLNQEVLDSQINQKLGIKNTNNALKIDDNKKLVKIPASFINRVKVTDKMKRLMIRDEKKNVYVDLNTPMAVDVPVGSAETGGELILGGKKGDKGEKLDRAGDDYFVESIDQNEVLKLRERESVDQYDVDKLKEAERQLRLKFPDDKKLKKTKDIIIPKNLIQELNTINQGNHKVKLTVKPNENGELEFCDPVEGDDGTGLEIVYRAEFEMIDAGAKDIAEKVYAEALKVEDPNILWDVKHKRWPEWTEFETAYDNLINGGPGENNINENNVKNKVIALLKELDRKNNSKFSDISTDIEGLTGDALVQSLMSIKNVFARSRQVWGGNENKKYEFKDTEGKYERTMENIINQRKTILNTLEKVLDSKVKEGDKQAGQAKERYKQLFNAVGQYVNVSKREKFKITSDEIIDSYNTIGFNLGDRKNPENPLFDPQSYKTGINLNELLKLKDNEGKLIFTQEAYEGLHKRSMNSFAKNPALINPVLKRVGIEPSDKKVKETLENVDNFKVNGNKCEVSLDIGDKKYTLSSGMGLGFFPQCVNLEIILKDITITGSDGMVVTFKSGVIENTSIDEGTGGTNDSTEKATGGISFTVSNEGTKGGPVATNLDGEGYDSFRTGENPDQKPPTVTPGDGTPTTPGGLSNTGNFDPN